MTTNFETFANLEAVFMDPDIQRVLEMVKSYNELLEAQPVSKEEIMEIVNELDEEWPLLLGSEAEFTGVAGFFRENDHSDDPIPVENYYENQDVVFRGVVARRLEQSGVTGEVAVDDNTDFYQLRIGFIREGIDDNLTVLSMHGSAAVDAIASLEFRQYMSPDRAKHWLEYYCSDVIDDIDDSLINANSINEAELVTELADYEWDLRDTKWSDDDKLLTKIKGAFEVYVRKMFNFDPSIGYAVHLDGAAWLEKGGEYVAISFGAAAIATDLSLHLENSPFETNEHIVKPHVKMILHDDDKDEVPVRVLIPVKSIVEMSSIRSSFYNSSN